MATSKNRSGDSWQRRSGLSDWSDKIDKLQKSAPGCCRISAKKANSANVWTVFPSPMSSAKMPLIWLSVNLRRIKTWSSRSNQVQKTKSTGNHNYLDYFSYQQIIAHNRTLKKHLQQYPAISHLAIHRSPWAWCGIKLPCLGKLRFESYQSQSWKLMETHGCVFPIWKTTFFACKWLVVLHENTQNWKEKRKSMPSSFGIQTQRR